MVKHSTGVRKPGVARWAALGALALLGLLAASILARVVFAGPGAPKLPEPLPAAQPGGDGPCPQVAPCPEAVLPQRAITPDIETNQDKLNNRVLENGQVIDRKSEYDFKTVLAKGRHLFTTPFIEADGAGEGIRDLSGEGCLGPREESFNSNLHLLQGKFGLADSDFGKLRDVFQPPFSHIDSKGQVRFSILRLNGLDSQSCFECHNSIGSAHVAGEGPKAALERKPGTTGGPAGQASNAFINDTFPYPVMKFVRNPPHVFGTGYVQKLAESITDQLLWQKAAAYITAVKFPGNEVSVSLVYTDPAAAKLIDFGYLRVTYVGDPTNPPNVEDLFQTLVSDAETDLSKDFHENQTEVLGVSPDLVVRPLQWKGIASNERNFVRSALAFHFGMGPRELNPGYRTPQEDHDPDHDGVRDEVSEGNVSALSIFTMSVRPPTSQVPDDKKEIVARGEKLFNGEATAKGGPAAGKDNACIKCHTPALPIYDTMVCVRDPRQPGEPSQLTHLTGLVAQQRSSKQLPVSLKLGARIKRMRAGKANRFDFMKQLDPKKMKPEEMVEKLDKEFRAMFNLPEPTGCPVAGYQFDLNMKGKSDFESLSFSYPRLQPEKDGTTVNVPLFSDFKRHDMGEGLADKFDQPTDVEGINVARREFLTRPLWGVADTGPWLHDGRARTLRDAILMHESLGSEANPVIDAFKKLNCDDQAAVVEFLLTLRLPIDCRYEPCFEKPAPCHPEPKKE